MERATVVRGAIANSALEGWAPTSLDVERLLALATGSDPLDEYVARAVERAQAAAETGPPDCIDVPQRFSDTLYPGTRILRNRFGIRDATPLQQLEFEIGTARQFGIETGLIDVPATFDGVHLIAIHRTLFGDVYPWSGVFRRYDMDLRHQSFRAATIERYLGDASAILRRPVDHLSPRGYAHHLAEAYAYLNCAHPFREGNGRSSKTLLQLAATRHGFRLDFAAVSKKHWDGASRRSAPDHGHYRPDAHALFRVFDAITVPAAGSR
ncbi:Fic family protein [Tsukamurella serpentis]